MKKIFTILLVLVALLSTIPVFAGSVEEVGDRHFTGIVTFDIKNTTTNAVTDGLTLKQETTGTPAAGIGVGIAMQVESGGGLAERGRINLFSTDVTDGSEDFNLRFYADTGGTITEVASFDGDSAATFYGSTDGLIVSYGSGTTDSDAYLRLVGDAGADAADRWQLFNDSSAGDLIIQNDTSIAGTYVTKLTIDGATGNVTLTGDIISENADTLDMSGDDKITFLSNDESATFALKGFDAKVARLQLLADEDDDATDGWSIEASTSGTLTIGNDVSVAGTFVDVLTISATSVTVTDPVILAHTDSPTACAGGTEGAIYYDLTSNVVCYCDGTSYKQVADSLTACQ